MEQLSLVFHNRILVCGVLSWLIAQVLKTIIYACVNRTLDLKRLTGDGGMPSGHSATVTAVALMSGYECGFDSPVFAVAFILAIIVMHDAMGVRREAGKHAELLNEMTDILNEITEIMESIGSGAFDFDMDAKLKEFVGHTPTQVAAGFVLGIIVTVVYAGIG